MHSASAVKRDPALPGRQGPVTLFRLGRRIASAPSIWYWAALGFSFLALYREFTVPEHLARGYFAWLSSDTLFDAGVYRDLKDGFPWSGTQFPMASSLFPDLLAVMLLMKLFGGAAAVANFAYGILQFTALVGVYIAAGRLARVARTEIVTASVLLVGIGLTFLVKGALPAGSQFIWSDLFQPHCHIGAEICRIAAVCCVLWMCFHKPDSSRWKLIGAMCGVLCFLITASDLSFIPQFTIAVTATAMFFWYLDLLSWRQFVRPLCIIWAGTIAGWFVSSRIVEHAGLYSISINRIGEALQTYLGGVMDNLAGADWAHVSAVIWIPLCLTTILRAIHRNVVRRATWGEMTETTRRKIFLFTFLAVSGIGSTICMLIMGVDGLAGHRDYFWAIHYQFPLYFGAFFGLGYMLAIFLNAVSAGDHRARIITGYVGVAVLVLCGRAALASPAGGASLWTYQPAYVRFLDENTSEYRLSAGITDYWLARSILLFSRKGMRAYPVTPDLDPFLWCDNRYWYRGYPKSRYPNPQYNFALFDNASFKAVRPALMARFGPPAEELVSGEYHLLVYNRAGDTAFRNVFALSEGLPPALGAPPPYTPGTILDFHLGGNAVPFKAGGWGQAEAGGTWTLGPKSTLLLSIDALPPQDLWMNIEMHAFAAPERPRFTESIFVNKTQVEQWQVDEHQPSKRQIRIPRRLLKSSLLQIDFVSHDPRSPADVGYSKDPRQLGLAVHTIRIEAASP